MREDSRKWFVRVDAEYFLDRYLDAQSSEVAFRFGSVDDATREAESYKADYPLAHVQVIEVRYLADKIEGFPEMHVVLDLPVGSDDSPEACPSCGCKPGEGITEGCNDEAGCGYYRDYEAYSFANAERQLKGEGPFSFDEYLATRGGN